MISAELDQIRKIIREETVSKEEFKASEERVKKEIKEEIHKVYSDIAGDLLQQITSAVSEQYSKLEKRVTRLDQHAGLPPLE